MPHSTTTRRDLLRGCAGGLGALALGGLPPNARASRDDDTHTTERAMKENIHWLLEMNIKPGQTDASKALMKEMIAATRESEPGTLNYEWYLDEREGVCHIHERYRDSAAVMVHLGNFGERFAERFLAAFEPLRLSVYGDPSDEAAEALSGFGAIFHAPTAGFAR